MYQLLASVLSARITKRRVLYALAAWIVFSLVFAGYLTYKERSERQALQAAREAIPADATEAAKLIYQAAKACRVISQQDIDACSAYKGELAAERSAVSLAQQAVARQADFYAKCGPFRDRDDCYGLLKRAFQIEMNSDQPR